MSGKKLFDEFSNSSCTNSWASTHLPENIRNIIKNLSYKPSAREFAIKLGLLTPKLYAENVGLFQAFSYIQAEQLNSVVVKPVQAKNSWCVLPISRVSSNKFYNIIEKNERSIEDLLSDTWAFYKKNKLGRSSGTVNKWIVEELLCSEDGKLEPIDDYKFYCFYGKIPLVLHKRNLFANGKWSSMYQWYDYHWRPIFTGKYLGKIDKSMRPSIQGKDQLIESAVNVSRKIPVPFIRLDLYFSSGKVYFGEFTQYPGGADKFDPTFSEFLAENWHQASVRLENDIAQGLCNTLSPIYE